MDGSNFDVSRRRLLLTLAVAPAATLPSGGRATASPQPVGNPSALVHQSAAFLPPLLRTREGRELSLFRYQNAEEFFGTIETGRITNRNMVLYGVGIVIQLGLSAYLLDVGFDDEWSARQLGLDVAKALAHANATGLGHNDPHMARLAASLSPYCKWNDPNWIGARECDFSIGSIVSLTRAVLNRVCEITGHPGKARILA